MEPGGITSERAAPKAMLCVEIRQNVSGARPSTQFSARRQLLSLFNKLGGGDVFRKFKSPLLLNPAACFLIRVARYTLLPQCSAT
jgi:hypothetical protein